MFAFRVLFVWWVIERISRKKQLVYLPWVKTIWRSDLASNLVQVSQQNSAN
jgi:hypothetical protein